MHRLYFAQQLYFRPQPCLGPLARSSGKRGLKFPGNYIPTQILIHVKIFTEPIDTFQPCSLEERREGKRERRPTKVFQFDDGHTLFAAKTRKCEEKKSKKEQKVEKKKRYRKRKIEERNGKEVARLQALVKIQAKKIKALEKKASKK